MPSARTPFASREQEAPDARETAARLLVFNEFTQLARAHGAVNLSQGLPEPLLDAAIRARLAQSAACAGWGYADPRGLGELRQAVARLYGQAQRQQDVVVTSGCTEALGMALGSLQGAYGSRIAVMEPFYPYYPGLARLAGLDVRLLRMACGGSGWQPDWEQLSALARNGTRALLLNTPHNPTGWVMDAQDMERLVSLARHHGMAVIVDHAYQGFIYDGRPDLAAQLALRMPERTWVAGTASKCLSAPGLRVGWLLAPGPHVEAALELHLHMTYCQPPPLQDAVAALLDKEGADQARITAWYQDKRDMLQRALLEAGLACTAPAGGHFIVAGYDEKGGEGGLQPRDHAVRFTRRHGVTPLPMDPFYAGAAPRQLRFSFAAPRREVERACAALAAARVA